MTTTTRESWLEAAQAALANDFSQVGYPFPHIARVSVGFPSKGGLSTRQRTIGQCWDSQAATDRRSQIFISPLLDEAVEVLGVLVHELIHHTVGCSHGHKGPFKRCAKAIGLEGKMTATVAGPALTTRLNALTATLGPYPHAALNPTLGRKKDGTRMKKIQCPNCGWTARTTQSGIDAGLPTCACGDQILEA